jgi:hypothetical protein
MTQAQYEIAHQTLTDKLADLTTRMDRHEASGVGSGKTVGYLFAGIGGVAGLIGIVIALLAMFAK